MHAPPGRLAVVVKGYPRLSETFIAQEILGLEQRGIPQLIVSLRHPYDDTQHDIHRRIRAEVLYLPEYLKDDPGRVRTARRKAEALPGHADARRLFEADLARDRTANRHRRWGQACVLATELPANVGWIHSHYLHTPASVTRYAAHMLGRPWSFSAHAKDIWTTPQWELCDKLADAAWGVTCTAINARHLQSLAKDPGKIELVYHGLDLQALPVPPRSVADGGRSGTFGIVTVGRAVDKKGFDDLLRALALLPNDLSWHLSHIGKGERLDRLKALAARLGIADNVTFMGAQTRAVVFQACRDADLFVLPSKIARSGDRDGLPNVLMEAQLCGLACISSRVSAIPELIEDGRTGLLVEPENPRELAAAIERLLRDAPLRRRIAEAGAAKVRAEFSSDPGLDRLAQRFRHVLVEPC